MSSSGLIYALIVGAWAVYLVPIWLRREEELNAARETNRFATAIRVLGHREAVTRRAAAGDTIDEVSPARDAATAAPNRAQTSAQTSASQARRSRGALVARRRRVVAALLAASLVGVMATAALGVDFLWLTGVPGVLFVAYAVYVRRDERQRLAERATRQRLAAERRRQQLAAEAARRAASQQPAEQRPAAVGESSRHAPSRPARPRSAATRRTARPRPIINEPGYTERPRAVGE